MSEQSRKAFVTVRSWGPDALACTEQAISHAIVTGAQGSSYIRPASRAVPSSGAEVTRDPQRIADLQADALGGAL